MDTSVSLVRAAIRMNYYDRLTDMNILYDAYKKSIKDVSWKYTVQKYMSMALPNLNQLRNELIKNTYRVKPFTEFDICERGKQRHIKSPNFSDKILQRAISDYILEPVLMPYLIYRNGASLKGKGVSFSQRELRKILHKYMSKYGTRGFVLVGDFKNFFASIPHDKLLEMMARYIQDERFMKLFQQMLLAYNPEGIGLAIGAHVSQICGVFYPTPIDKYITIVKGQKYYIRHMDDFLVFHEDRNVLEGLLKEIEMMAKDLGLTINHKKTQICRIDQGFRFLKVRMRVTNTGKIVEKPCKDNVKRERKKLKRFKVKLDNGEMEWVNIRNQYLGWRGTMKQYDSKRVLHRTDIEFVRLFGDTDQCISCKHKNNDLSDEPCCRCDDFRKDDNNGRE